MNINNNFNIVGKLLNYGQSCMLNGNHALIIKVQVDENDIINLYVPTSNHYLFWKQKGILFKFIGHVENKYGQKIVVDNYSEILS